MKRQPGADRAEVFLHLRSILTPYAKHAVVKRDALTDYYLESPKPHEGKPLFFAAVRGGKAYVSFHLFPIYMYPDLLDGIPPGLAARKQGKACFNFTRLERDPVLALADLTRRGFDRFRENGLI